MAETKSTDEAVESKGSEPGDNGTSKPDSQFTSDDHLAAAHADPDNEHPDPAIDGVQGLSDEDEVAERSPDGSEPGQFTKAFILDRLDLDADGKTPKGFDHNPNIDGTRSFGVQSGVRFTGPIKLLHDKASKVAPGTRVLTYGGPAVPAGTLDENGAPVGDHYDPTVVDVGEAGEHVESNSAEAKAAE